MTLNRLGTGGPADRDEAHRMMGDITGRTRVFATVADPIGHVRTPEEMNRLLAARGFDGVMIPLHVQPEDLARAVMGLRTLANLGGFIVTVPHKSAMIGLCDQVTEHGRAVGAVNAVRREPDGTLVADMLDGRGFLRGLERAGIEVSGACVYLAGAGGAANAIAFALAEAGAASLSIANRTQAKIDHLLGRLTCRFPGLRMGVAGSDPAGHDLIVNATSLGLRPDDPLPLDVAGLEPGMVVAEIIMKPVRTRLLEAAERAGCRTQPGLPMLIGQIELMADFLGATSPSAPDESPPWVVASGSLAG